jgi:predicted GH43/DUF377 family glycosyl hydrolase
VILNQIASIATDDGGQQPELTAGVWWTYRGIANDQVGAVALRWETPRPLFLASPAENALDISRAFSPSVLEEPDGRLRMWYSGDDGSTCRILEAVQQNGLPWQRVGLSIDAGMWGDTDAYGVESPSVVVTPGGYLMAYAGSDGADTRLHMASSADGHRWEALGPFIHRGEQDAVGATHPCLMVTRKRWWLFYSGYDGSNDGRRASILGAVSQSGASWDRVGSVLQPDDGEIGVTEPWVIGAKRHLVMFYVSEDEANLRIDMATSADGVDWRRQGNALRPSPDNLAVRSPCAMRMLEGKVRLWYAARPVADTDNVYRLWSTDYRDRP